MTGILSKLAALTAKNSPLIESMAEEYCEADASEADACGYDDFPGWAASSSARKDCFRDRAREVVIGAERLRRAGRFDRAPSAGGMRGAARPPRGSGGTPPVGGDAVALYNRL